MPNQPSDTNPEKAESQNDRLERGADKALRQAITTSDRQELTETAIAQNQQEASNRMLTPEEAAVLAKRQQKVVGDATGALGFSPSLTHTASDGTQIPILPGRTPEDVARLKELQELAKSGLPLDPDQNDKVLVAQDPRPSKPVDLTQAGQPFRPFFDAVGGLTAGSSRAIRDGLEHLEAVTGVNPEPGDKQIGPARNPGDALNTLGGTATSTVRGLDAVGQQFTSAGVERQVDEAVTSAKALGSYLGEKAGRNELYKLPGDVVSAGKVGLDKIVNALASMTEDSSVERGELAGIAVLFFAANGDFIKDSKKQGLHKLSEHELSAKGLIKKEVDLEAFSRSCVASLEQQLFKRDLAKDGVIPETDGRAVAKQIAGTLRPVCKDIDEKNISFAQLDVECQRFMPIGINGKDAPAGTVSKPEKPSFQTFPKGAQIADQDSEYKILEQVGTYLRQLKKETGREPQGTLALYSEQAPCKRSCQKVIEQFRVEFPGMNFKEPTWSYINKEERMAKNKGGR